MNDEYAIGGEKLSLTITRKNHADQVVSQWSVQRWFESEGEAVEMLSSIIVTLVAVVHPEEDVRGELQGHEEGSSLAHLPGANP